MDFVDKEYAIYQIASGRYYIDVDDTQYIYVEPSKELLLAGILKRKNIEKECISDGFFTDEEEQQLLLENGIWTSSDEELLEKCYKDIKLFSQQKKEYQFQSFKLAQLNDLIDKAKKKITELIRLKNTFYSNTVRYQSEVRYYHWLLMNGLHYIDNDRVWKTEEEFDNSVDPNLIAYLTKLIFYDGIYKVSEIREIARTEPWRTIWKTAQKLGTNIFDCDPAYQSKLQYTLVYWSIMYDAVFENPDAPHQDIIDNDEAMDNWLSERQAEYESRQKNRSANQSLIKNSKIANSQEIFIPVNTREDAQKVYNQLNNSASLQRFRARQRLLYEKGKLREDQMPDTKLSLKMKANQVNSKRIKSS